MPKVVVVGAGFGGVSAAACARNAGAEVTLVERTDELLGVGRNSGIFYNDGRQAGSEELKAMGGGYILDIIEAPPVLTHPRTEMNWNTAEDLKQQIHTQAIFHCMKAETHIRKYLKDIGVDLIFANRAVDVEVGRSQQRKGGPGPQGRPGEGAEARVPTPSSTPRAGRAGFRSARSMVTGAWSACSAATHSATG